MNNESSSILGFASQLSGAGIAILAVLSAFLILWFVLRYLVRRWQARSRTASDEVDKRLRALNQRIAALAEEADVYPPDLSEPYQTPARELSRVLDRARRNRDAAAEAYHPLTREAPQPPDSVPAHVRFGLWDEPRFWWDRIQRLKALDEEIQTAFDQTGRADALLRDLRAKPLETAHKAQALLASRGLALETLNDLAAAGLHGEAIDKQTSALKIATARLQALPDYFLDGTDSQVVRQATDDEVSRAWETLRDVEIKSDQTPQTVERWQTTYDGLGEALKAARRAVDRGSEALDAVHPTIEMTAWAREWAQTRALLEDLEANYASPTVEDLDHIDQVQAIEDQGQELRTRLETLEEARVALTEAIPRFWKNLRRAERELRRLANKATYPLDRKPLQREVDRLSEKATHLGETNDVRPPARLEADAAAAQDGVRASRALLEEIAEVGRLRETLVAQFETLDADLEPELYPWAESLHEETVRYAPENWDPTVNVTDILVDAEALDRLRDQWVPEDPTAPLPTSNLDRRVEEVQKLMEEGRAFQERLARIADRLDEVAAIARRSRETLGTAYQALDQLALRAADVSPALDADQAAIRAELMDRLEQGYKLDVAFDPPVRDPVEIQEAEVETWLASSQETLETWLQAINRELKEMHGTLEAQLAALRELAPMAMEPAVQDAQAWVEDHPDFPPLKRNPDDPVEHLVALAEVLGERLRARTHLHRAADYLQTDVVDTLAMPLDAWERARKEAERRVSALLEREREAKTAWLPVGCDSQAVEAQMSAAYASETQLANHGQTVQQTIATLREVTRTYNKAIAMAEAREQTHDQTQTYVKTRRQDIEQWRETLETYRQAHEADATTVAAIRARLDEIDAALRQLSERYGEEGRLVAPAEARRRLEHLWEQARRDLPLGAGYDVIPTRHIERGW